MENFYYECIYDVLWNNHPHQLKMTMLNRLKAKITTLHRTRLQCVMLDNVDPNRLEGEKPVLFYILQTWKWQEVRMILSVQDEHENTQTTMNGIMRAFMTFLIRKYEPIAVEDESIERMAEIGRRNLPTAWREQLEQPIIPEEVHIAMRKGGKKKAPGSDRLVLEFYKANWATIKDDMGELMNQMFIERKVSPQQKHGVIVCLPKICEPTTLADFRPITLLNTDYKMMARIIVNRLRPIMAELLQQSQFCGAPSRTILEVVATMREAIAQAEITQVPLCILSLDFQEAFDRIYQYLFSILKNSGLSDWFIDRIRGMYEGAASSVQINGHIAGPIPIQCSVRQGRPMSMILFALCVDPLLRILEQKLPGIHIGKRANKTVVVAYADDVTIFVTSPTDLPVIHDAIQCYEKATGAHLNARKLKALAVGGWSTTTVPLGIPYANEIKILGVTFSSTIEQSTKKSWAIVTESEPRRGTLTRETYAFLSGFGMCTHTS